MSDINDGTFMIHKGKHAGKTIEEIPSDYLKYIVDNWDDEDVVEAAGIELGHRTQYSTHWYD